MDVDHVVHIVMLLITRAVEVFVELRGGLLFSSALYTRPSGLWRDEHAFLLLQRVDGISFQSSTSGLVVGTHAS